MHKYKHYKKIVEFRSPTGRNERQQGVLYKGSLLYRNAHADICTYQPLRDARTRDS